MIDDIELDIEESDTITLVIPSDHAGQRLDKILAILCTDFSRSRLQDLIASGQVRVNDRLCKTASSKISTGDVIDIAIPPPAPAAPAPENIPLDILYEDDDLLVINKQAGLVVHPGAGNRAGTLVNALLAHCGDSLSGIGGVARPGIVHRLDKDTSGLMVAAKNDRAHKGLAAQLEDRSLHRLYHALVLKIPFPPTGRVDAPIGRHPKNRLKMAVLRQGGREAATNFRLLENYRDALALIECTLETGRTHQIRVHMDHAGHPLIGDPLYGPQATAVKAALDRAACPPETAREILGFPRQALHAAGISFTHPGSGKTMNFEIHPPQDLSKVLKLLKN